MSVERLANHSFFWAFPFGSGYTLQCQLALRDSVGISAAIPNALKMLENKHLCKPEKAKLFTNGSLNLP
jgi:hypothetical protein